MLVVPAYPLEQLKRHKIGVLMGGRSAERDISLKSGRSVLEALLNQGFTATGVEIGDQPCRAIVEAEIRVAFLALHGRFGEDGCIQGLLESEGIPYTGPGVLASALAMDKVVSKRMFEGAGLPTPPWVFPATTSAVLSLGLPVVLKPRAEGSSVGLTIARNERDVRNALELSSASSIGVDHPMHLLAEQMIEGRELSVGVLGTEDSARVLGTVEIRTASGIYDYQAKYHSADTEYLVPAPVPPTVTARLGELALAAHQLLECSGATRVDFRWTGQLEDDPMLLEVNTLPGMTAHSLLPKIAAHAGLSYEQLVQTIVAEARLKA